MRERGRLKEAGGVGSGGKLWPVKIVDRTGRDRATELVQALGRLPDDSNTSISPFFFYLGFSDCEI
jgi:hypothetical protein